MHHRIAATLSAAALALPTANVALAIPQLTAQAATAKKTVVTRKVTGTPGSADRWGTVTVTLSVRKTTTVAASGKRTIKRHIVAVNATYNVHTNRSEFIMTKALPVLRREALSAQSANISMVSGATDTSEAFGQSLQAALVLAHRV